MKKLVYSLFAIAALVASVSSCNKNELVDPKEGVKTVNFTVSGNVDPTLTKTYIEQDGNTYLAHWSAVSNEHLGLVFDVVNADASSVTFDALDITNDIATFYGSAEVTEGSHTIHPFYPASAYSKCYASGKIGLTLNHEQHPTATSFDPAADIMIGADQTVNVDDAEEILIENVVFTRPLAVLRLHLIAKNSEATAYDEEVTSVEMSVLGQSSSFALTGLLAYTPDNDELTWNTSNASVKAVYSSENGNASEILIDPDADNNSAYLVINPVTVPAGAKIQFDIETTVHNGINKISRTITVPEGGMEFLAGKVNEINLTVRDKDVPDVVADTRILVEGFDNVSVNKTQAAASATGVFGTGVSSNLEYTYSTDNTNIRFSNNGQSSDNPYLYINAADQYLTISNIAVSEQTWLDFTAKVKNAGTLTIYYKESSASTWATAGTIAGGTTFNEGTVSFLIANTVESLDLQLVGSTALLVDDLVLESGTAPEHNLSVANTTITLGSDAASTETITITSNYAWTASITSGSGFTFTPAAGGPDGSIVVTASNNGPATEGEIGQLTITDGTGEVVVHVRQKAYVASGTKYTKITSLTDLTSGEDYVIVAANGTKNYALPVNPTVNNGKITGSEIVVTDGSISESAASGFVWTITKSGDYYTISDGTKYIYHSNGGSSGTNLAYGPSTSYPWSITVGTGSYGTFKLAGVNSSTVKDRGILYSTDNSVFGGYALSNYGTAKYPGIDLYKKTTSSGGGTENPSTYSVSIADGITNGRVVASKTTGISEGESVTLTITPDTGYELETLTVDNVDVTASVADGKYVFNMPAKDVSVSAQFKSTHGSGDTKTIISIDFTTTDQRPSNFPSSSDDKGTTLTSYTIAGYSFSFYAATGYYWINSSNGKYLLIGKTDSYILLPAIEGKKLTKVEFHTGSGASTSVIPKIYSADGETAIYNNTTATGQDKDYTWNLSNTANNTAYQLRITNKYNAQFTKLELTYE